MDKTASIARDALNDTEIHLQEMKEADEKAEIMLKYFHSVFDKYPNLFIELKRVLAYIKKFNVAIPRIKLPDGYVQYTMYKQKCSISEYTNLPENLKSIKDFLDSFHSYTKVFKKLIDHTPNENIVSEQEYFKCMCKKLLSYTDNMFAKYEKMLDEYPEISRIIDAMIIIL